jgi:FKBP-type peptidyl-prolyl cis-trans isomerase
MSNDTNGPNLAERVFKPINFEALTTENIEEELKNLNLFEDDYRSDDDTRDKIKLTGKGLDMQALRTGNGFEFGVDDQQEDDFNWDDELDEKIDYEKIFRYRNTEMIGEMRDDDDDDDDQTDLNNNNNNNDDNNNENDTSAMTPFEVLRTKMSDITAEKNGGVLKRRLVPGVGALILPGSRVRIHYNAYFEMNDEPFDSTHLRNKTFEFKLGANTAVFGLEVAVASMKKHEKSQFIFEPDYYMGEIGCEPRVPKSTPVLFEVEVVSFIEASAYDEYENKSAEQRKKLTLDQILLICNCLRELGNDNYRRMNFKEASKKYRKAIYLLDNTPVNTEEEDAEFKRIMLKLVLNMSQICLKQQKPKKTIYYCKQALEFDPNNVKALFRYGSSLRILQDFDRSRKFLLRAYKLDASCQSITKEIQILDEMISKYKSLQKDIYRKMFNITNETNSETANNVTLALKGPDDSADLPAKKTRLTDDFFIDQASSLQESKALIEKKIKEFADNPYMLIYKIQPDLYPKEIVDFILAKAKAFNMGIREIRGLKNVIHIVKK